MKRRLSRVGGQRKVLRQRASRGRRKLRFWLSVAKARNERRPVTLPPERTALLTE